MSKLNSMETESVERITRVVFGESVHNYLAETSDAPPGFESRDEVQMALRDLLTDIRHFAAAKGLDFDSAVQGSREVCAEEHATE